MLNEPATCKYETPYKGSFAITRCCTDGAVNLHYYPIKISHNIRQIKPYKSDTNVEDINPDKKSDDVSI